MRVSKTLYSTRNVQGQTHIKVNFNFVQGHSDNHSDTHSDKATLCIIELLTSQLKVLERISLTFYISYLSTLWNLDWIDLLVFRHKVEFGYSLCR